MKGGVIIIGSLLWDDHLNDNKNLRKNWRENNLDLTNAIRVQLPIRYGRQSNKGEITMVFSTMLERSNNLGIGYVIPFKRSPINKYKILENEAVEIAKAEGLGEIGNPRFYTSWGGALGILFKKSNTSQSKLFYKKWRDRFNNDKENKTDFNFSINGEKKSVKNGKLQIKWPICVDKRDLSILNELDFLIGASNNPKYINEKKTEVLKYPNIDEIASASINDRKRFYFINNIKHGILTFQDLRILNKMKSKTQDK